MLIRLPLQKRLVIVLLTVLCTIILLDIKELNHVLTLSESTHLMNRKNTSLLRYGILSSQKHSEEIPILKVDDIPCDALFKNDSYTQHYASRIQKTRTFLTNSQMSDVAKNCSYFLRSWHFILYPLTPEEEEFPIAYGIVMYKDTYQVTRLLRAIYRPQNYYCLHIDSKAGEDVKLAMLSITRCFDNVFISSRSVDVWWGSYSLVEVDLICMQELLAYPGWKYFINLTGQEFPLRTNWELVQIFKVMNGANNMDARMNEYWPKRTKYVHHGFRRTLIEKQPCPYNMTVAKGSKYVAAERGFVEFVIWNESAHALAEWVRDTAFPDETYLPTLNINPQLNIPGSFKGEPKTNNINNTFIIKFNIMQYNQHQFKCSGLKVRGVCIFGILDLPLLASRPELFLNKFHMEYNPVAYDCMEERHFNRTINDLVGKHDIDLEFYKNLGFVQMSNNWDIV